MLIEVPVVIFGIYGVPRRLCCVFRDQLLPVFAGRKPCVLVPSTESIRDSSRSLLDVNMSISSSQPFLSASSVRLLAISFSLRCFTLARVMFGEANSPDFARTPPSPAASAVHSPSSQHAASAVHSPFLDGFRRNVRLAQSQRCYFDFVTSVPVAGREFKIKIKKVGDVTGQEVEVSPGTTVAEIKRDNDLKGYAFLFGSQSMIDNLNSFSFYGQCSWKDNSMIADLRIEPGESIKVYEKFTVTIIKDGEATGQEVEVTPQTTVAEIKREHRFNGYAFYYDKNILEKRNHCPFLNDEEKLADLGIIRDIINVYEAFKVTIFKEDEGTSEEVEVALRTTVGEIEDKYDLKGSRFSFNKKHDLSRDLNMENLGVKAGETIRTKRPSEKKEKVNRSHTGTSSQMQAADPPTSEDHPCAAASSHGPQGAAASFKVYIQKAEPSPRVEVEVTPETTVGEIKAQHCLEGYVFLFESLAMDEEEKSRGKKRNRKEARPSMSDNLNAFSFYGHCAWKDNSKMADLGINAGEVSYVYETFKVYLEKPKSSERVEVGVTPLTTVGEIKEKHDLNNTACSFAGKWNGPDRMARLGVKAGQTIKFYATGASGDKQAEYRDAKRAKGPQPTAT